MSLYSVLMYVHFCRKAKTRHQVHSPFVFELIEQVLRHRQNGTFRERLVYYFGAEQVIWVDGQQSLCCTDSYQSITQIILTKGIGNCVIIIDNIYKTATHTQCWNLLYQLPEVRLSIDLFHHGLLFFREEFREKQHFMLRYRS